jgi:hypothetical protein
MHLLQRSYKGLTKVLQRSYKGLTKYSKNPVSTEALEGAITEWE